MREAGNKQRGKAGSKKLSRKQRLHNTQKKHKAWIHLKAPKLGVRSSDFSAYEYATCAGAPCWLDVGIV